MERVQKANAVYDFKRALWFNSEYIKRMSDEEFVTKVKNYLYLYGGEERKEIIEASEDAYWMTFAPYIKVRIQTLEQFKDYCQYFFVRLPVSDELVNKEKMKITPELVAEMLPELIELLEHLTEDQWEEETIKDELISYISTK